MQDYLQRETLNPGEGVTESPDAGSEVKGGIREGELRRSPSYNQLRKRYLNYLPALSRSGRFAGCSRSLNFAGKGRTVPISGSHRPR
jgi:hypothetical protein